MSKYVDYVPPRLENESNRNYDLFLTYIDKRSMQALVGEKKDGKLQKSQLYYLSRHFKWDERIEELEKNHYASIRNQLAENLEAGFAKNQENMVHCFLELQDEIEIYYTDYKVRKTLNKRSKEEVKANIKEFMMIIRMYILLNKKYTDTLADMGFSQVKRNVYEARTDFHDFMWAQEKENNELSAEEIDSLLTEDYDDFEENEEKIEEQSIIVDKNSIEGQKIFKMLNEQLNNFDEIINNNSHNMNNESNTEQTEDETFVYPTYTPHTFPDCEDIDEEAEMYDRYPFLKLIKN